MIALLFQHCINNNTPTMEKAPIITCCFFEPSPLPETGVGDVGWPLTPDLVEASDQVVWSENHNELTNMTANAQSP